MTTTDYNEKSTELLTNWSKWLISVNFIAGTGCIVALKTAAAEAVARTGKLFFGAVGCFGASLVVATVFILLLAAATNGPRHYLWLAKLQLLFFIAGLIFVLWWIAYLSKVL